MKTKKIDYLNLDKHVETLISSKNQVVLVEVDRVVADGEEVIAVLDDYYDGTENLHDIYCEFWTNRANKNRVKKYFKEKYND